jgi:pimeloyl-ACP methyl ester carboxylesterase
MYEPDEVYDPYAKEHVPNPKKPRSKKQGPKRRTKIAAGCRGCLSRLIVIFILLLLIVLVPVVLGFAYDMAQSQNEDFAPLGQIITVNDRAMHLYCVGEGSPTVILEAGEGNWSIHWSTVQYQVGATTRVCSYDRAGYGWSDPNPEPRTVVEMSGELNALLDNAGETGPFVLVAHSTAGANARFFAYSFPNKVVGLVLVDAIHEDQFAEFIERASGDIDRMKIAEFLAPIRILRLMDRFVKYDQDVLQGVELSEHEARIFRAATYDQSYWETLIAEYEGLERSALAMRPVSSLGDLPLVVLMNDGRDWQAWPTDEIYQQAQLDLAASSTDTELVHSDGGEHFIHLENPGLFLVAVDVVVGKARTRMNTP